MEHKLSLQTNKVLKDTKTTCSQVNLFCGWVTKRSNLHIRWSFDPFSISCYPNSKTLGGEKSWLCAEDCSGAPRKLIVIRILLLKLPNIMVNTE